MASLKAIQENVLSRHGALSAQDLGHVNQLMRKADPRQRAALEQIKNRSNETRTEFSTGLVDTSAAIQLS